MARLIDLNSLGLRGKLGSLIVYEVNGQQLVRTKPGKYKDRQSILQLMQRQRLSVVQQFLKSFRHLIKLYNKPETPGKTAYGEAVAWHLKNALTGQYPNITVDPSKAQFIKGTLPGVAFTKVERRGREVLLEWVYDRQAGGDAHDVLQLVTLGVGDQRAFDVDGMAQRMAQQTTVTVAYHDHDPLHLWAFFVSVRQGTVSTCAYLGLV